MAVAYLSRMCGDSADFGRLMAQGEYRGTPTVFVEDDVTLPWYVDAVPTLVVPHGDTIEVYARDDAFSFLGAAQRAPSPVEARAPPQVTHAAPRAKQRVTEPSGFDGDAAFEGIYDASDEPAVVGCGANYETLIDGDRDADVTEATMREWEQSLAEDRGSREEKKRESNSADKQLERLMKQREQQVPAPAVVRT
jgi:hypothetical protein